MNDVIKLKEKVLGGALLTKEELLTLVDAPLEELKIAACEIRNFFLQDEFDTCSIVAGKSGRCGEDCKFCAQSAHYKTSSATSPLLSKEKLVEAALYNDSFGVDRFSVVTSGGALSEKEIELLCESYSEISKKSEIKLCSSNGALTKSEFEKLKNSGVERYHCNLESSRNFFPKICSTHTFDSKLSTIQNAKEAGLEICSGGIIGLGESFEDRIDMALELQKIGVVSVPINVLNPISGTPLEHNKILEFEEIAKTVAIFKFALPHAHIRLAGGRINIKNLGRDLFSFGVSAVITGNMLTTTGADISEDLEAIKRRKE